MNVSSPRMQVGITKEAFREKLKNWEGYVNHFYADHRGYVTCGIGSLVDPVAKYTRKLLQLEFYEAKTPNKKFTLASDRKKVVDSFNTVKNGHLGVRAAAAKTNIRITETSLNSLFENDFDIAKKDAVQYYSGLPATALFPSFDKLPVNVQFALVEMSFNLGYPKLSQYKNLKKLLSEGNFAEAANQTFRHGGLQPDRNQTVFDWVFMYSDKAFAQFIEMRNTA